MGFVSLQFVIFICIVLAAHRLTAPRYRYVVLFAASCYFYACAGIGYLAVLLAVTVWTYLGGICIERYRSPAVYRLFWWGNLAALAFCKIGNLMTDSVLLPVGMSFYVFSTCWYLSDVYRKGLAAERNPIRYAAYATFFPSILSGPIQKGRELLPMIQRGGAASVVSCGQCEPRRDARSVSDTRHRRHELCRDMTAAPGADTDVTGSIASLAIHGFELFLWGMAVKLFVSNRLSPAVAYIFDRPGFYSKAYYLPAAILFALQLYADFAAYSDMAIGVAAMLGYPLKRNFNNPFLSTSLSELWNRWHVSLNEWFLENIYYPLGGSRRGQVRKYRNTMVIFLVSGLWHGQGVHFLFWGFYNGVLMLIGQFRSLIFRHDERAECKVGVGSVVESANTLRVFADRLQIRETESSVESADVSADRPVIQTLFTWLRRVIVFLLFSMTFIYFRASTMEAGNVMTLGILTIRPSDLAGFYPQQMFGGSTATMIITLLLTLAFLMIQYLRREEDGAAERNLARWNRMPAAARILLLAVVLAACVIAACGASATTNSQFVYYNF